MIPKEITAEHVVAAMAEIRAAGSPSTRSSRGYSIVYEGEHFPPKYVVSLAAKYAVGRELRPNQFNGGQETNSFLRGLGFDIAGTSAPGISPCRPKKTGKKPVTTHNERCQECKNVVTAMLKVLYGTVETNKRFQIGALPEAFEKSAYSSRLDAIYEALQSSRGFKDFVRASSLPACDYFVPEPGFILEFDESQHFTEHRQLALSQYPSELPMSFDAARWRHLCQQIGARDNEPPFRDEQRAWYDTLRDFLPTVFSLKPTSRLYVSEYPWCTLQPNSAEDVTKFRQILSERTYVWTINMGAIRGQRFVRLVMDGAWGGD